jgi:hypothetical protein
MSDLRTRIAKALYGQILHPVPPFDSQPDEVKQAWLADADAVIAELGLRRDTVGLIHRWVTEWETTND